MGHSHVHPSDSEPLQGKQQKMEGFVINKTEQQEDQQIKRESQIMYAINLPCFEIKESPFKNYSNSQRSIVGKMVGILPQNENNVIQAKNQAELKVTMPSQPQEKSTSSVNTSLCVFYTPKLLHIILDFLPAQDCLNVNILNHRFSTQIFLYRLFHCQNNWQFTLNQIKQKMEKENLNDSFFNMLNIGQGEQSQHSLDLERLESFFVDGEQVNQQILRVDKIMKALIASGVQYFQGLNSMIIVLLHLFNNDSSYWIIRLLLHRTKNLQNDPENYSKIINKLQIRLKRKCPLLVQKLESYDLDIAYFLMGWIMSLFANDLQKSVVLQVWDLILSFGSPALQWFVVQLFSVLQSDIMSKCSSDEVNFLLKKRLKSVVKGETAKKILQKTRISIAEQVYGQGCAEIVQSWNHYKDSIKLDFPKFFSCDNQENGSGKKIEKISQMVQQQEQSSSTQQKLSLLEAKQSQLQMQLNKINKILLKTVLQQQQEPTQILINIQNQQQNQLQPILQQNNIKNSDFPQQKKIIQLEYSQQSIQQTSHQTINSDANIQAKNQNIQAQR